MSRLNLAYDAKRYFNNQTGLGNYARNLIANLVEYVPEHNYHLYTPSTNDLIATPAIDNLSVKKSNSIFKSYWRSFSIKEQLKNDKIDIYHGLSNEIPFYSSRTNFKNVLTVHDVIFKVLPQTFPLADRMIYDLKTKSSCQAADLIIAISANTKKDLIKHYNVDPCKIKVIPQTCKSIFKKEISPTEIESVKNKYKLPSEFILSVGTIEERKNVSLLIKAMPQLAPDLQIPIVIVGKASAYKKSLVKQLAALNLNVQIIWIHELNDDAELKAIYHLAKLLVYPSIYEGFGLPVLEALYSQLPVITSNTSSLTEAGGPFSIYVDPNDSEELAFQIAQVLQDSQLILKMKKQGLAYAQSNFDAKKLSQTLSTAYLSII